MSQLERVQFSDPWTMQSQYRTSCAWHGSQWQSDMARQIALACWSHSTDGTPSVDKEWMMHEWQAAASAWVRRFST